jgi:ferredoxin
MTYKVSVDKEKCIGCGSCTSVCPEFFELDEGKARPIHKQVEDLESIEQADSICPSQAIKIEKV